MKRAHYVIRLIAIICCLCTTGISPVRADGTTPDADEASPSGFVAGTEEEDASTSPIDDVDLGHNTQDPYKAMVEDIVAAPGADRPTAAAELLKNKNESGRALFYDDDELKARMAAVKSTLSSLFGDDGPKAESDEERELSLQKDIAMRGAYRGAALPGGRAYGGASSSSAAQAPQDEATGRLRLAELAFLLWDILTHPLTLTVLVLYALARLTVAIFRVARNPHGDKHKGQRASHHRGHSRPMEPVARQAAGEPAPKAEQRHRHRHHASRRHRRKRSFLDYFRSV